MNGDVVVSWGATRGGQEAVPRRVQLGDDVMVISGPACTGRLVREARVPLLVVRDRWPARVERVVVPLDLSAGPWRVGPAALGLAEAHGAEVVLVAVGDPFRPSFQATVDDAERLFARAGARARLVLAGRTPFSQLTSTLEAEAPDVIAVATQPWSPSSIAGVTIERVLELLLDEGTTSLLVVGDRAERSLAPARTATPGRRPTRRLMEVTS